MILNLLRKRFKYIMFYLFDIQKPANVTASGELNLGRDFLLQFISISFKFGAM